MIWYVAELDRTIFIIGFAPHATRIHICIVPLHMTTTTKKQQLRALSYCIALATAMPIATITLTEYVRGATAPNQEKLLPKPYYSYQYIRISLPWREVKAVLI